IPGRWQTSALAGDYRGRSVLPRRVRQEQQCNQHRTDHGKKGENWHWRALASERNAVQDQQAHKNCRQRQTEHLCSPILTRTEYLCSCALICICHDVDPRISLFCGQQGKARARPSGRPSARRSPSTIERSRKPIPRCNKEVRKWGVARRFRERIASFTDSALEVKRTSLRLWMRISGGLRANN